VSGLLLTIGAGSCRIDFPSYVLKHSRINPPAAIIAEDLFGLKTKKVLLRNMQCQQQQLQGSNAQQNTFWRAAMEVVTIKAILLPLVFSATTHVIA
jgi:hypothetical protein